MPLDDYLDEDDGSSEKEEPSDFDLFGSEALGISLDDPGATDRLAALKEAIMSCMGTDYGADKGKAKGKASKDKDEGGLALIFGGR